MTLYNQHPHRELAESVRLLVEAGADINSRAGPDGDDRTALIAVTERKCCTRILQALQQNGADVFMPSDATGATAVHQAAMVGNTDSCKVLLASAGSRAGSLLNAQDRNGYTPLGIACALKQPDVAAFLIKAGAGINAVNYDGHTVLIAAARCSSISTVQLLLDHGADVSTRDNLGHNALFNAARQGQVSVMILLVQRGLSVRAVDNDGFTVLMMATGGGSMAATEWLIQLGVA
eukprot:6509-Heterococcus_DN1.PRE.3